MYSIQNQNAFYRGIKTKHHAYKGHVRSLRYKWPQRGETGRDRQTVRQKQTDRQMTVVLIISEKFRWHSFVSVPPGTWAAAIRLRIRSSLFRAELLLLRIKQSREMRMAWLDAKQCTDRGNSYLPCPTELRQGLRGCARSHVWLGFATVSARVRSIIALSLFTTFLSGHGTMSMALCPCTAE